MGDTAAGPRPALRRVTQTPVSDKASSVAACVSATSGRDMGVPRGSLNGALTASPSAPPAASSSAPPALANLPPEVQNWMREMEAEQRVLAAGLATLTAKLEQNEAVRQVQGGHGEDGEEKGAASAEELDAVVERDWLEPERTSSVSTSTDDDELFQELRTAVSHSLSEGAVAEGAQCDLFSFCVWLIFSRMPLRNVVHAWTLFISLSCVQLVLTFGYYDASTLIYWLKGFGAVFQDAFEKEFMYLHTRLDRVPTVNVLCAVLSIINMNFVIRRDFVGTLRSCILGFKTHRHIREGEPPVRAALHSWLTVFLPVYCGITVRAILLPAYTACAAPLAFRGATAADIVLSSMSLSFLFDLDDMLYGYLLSSRQRGIYEGSMAQFQSHHFTLGFKERRLIGLYAWSLWALDVAWMICYYLTLVGYDVIGLPFAIRNDGRHDDDLAPIAVVRFECVQIMPWW